MAQSEAVSSKCSASRLGEGAVEAKKRAPTPKKTPEKWPDSISSVEAHLLCELAAVGDASVLEQLRQEGDDDHLMRVRAGDRVRVLKQALKQLRQQGAMVMTSMGCRCTYRL